MRKSVVPNTDREQPREGHWLDLQQLASVEVTSEDAAAPVEGALLPGSAGGWRAAEPGEQTIRLRFDVPQRLRRIRLTFAESSAERTQEFVLRWSAGPDAPPRDVLRQRWTFSPGGSTREVEDYRVELDGVAALELSIVPDIGGGSARASLQELRLA